MSNKIQDTSLRKLSRWTKVDQLLLEGDLEELSLPGEDLSRRTGLPGADGAAPLESNYTRKLQRPDLFISGIEEDD